MNALPDAFAEHLAGLSLPAARALVAVSGGTDSVALLHLLHRTADRHRLELVVAHFDHGIHPDSAAMADAVRRFSAALGYPCEIGRGGLGSDAGETRARAARWAWLEQTRRGVGAELIVTAHHADDQAETVLMRALRGSGPAGLAGMAARDGRLVRPLLPFRRASLERYAREHGLPVWHDPANADRRHLRAWLRHDLLPMIRARMPEVDRALLSMARQARRDRIAWDATLELLPGLEFRLEPCGYSVAAASLGKYDSHLAEALLLATARRASCPLGPARARRVLRLAARAASGRRVELGGGWIAELAFGRVMFTRADSRPAPASWNISGHTGEGRWGRWRLTWRTENAPAAQERRAWQAWFVPGPLTVRGPTAGERMRPLGAPGRRLVVRCFQEARVPRNRRSRWPAIAGPAGVVWIPGVCRSDALLPTVGAEAVRVDAEYA